MSVLGSSAVVDLSSPSSTSLPLPPTDEPFDALSSLTTLGNSLDNYSTDVSQLINDLLSPHLPPSAPGAPPKQPDLAPIDKTLNELLTRLSLLSQDTSSNLEQSIHDISRTVPRLTYDLQFMRESATSLRSSLSVVQSQMRTKSTPNGVGDSEEAKTHRALEKLTHLDKLKTRMESARDILREAESWSTLEGEITAFIADAAWYKAGARLAEANRSMVVFQNTPGEYESRRTLLVSLQNELEGALAKALQGAIDAADTEGIARLREVFEMIERNGEFRDYYFSAKRKVLVDEWNNAVILDSTASSTLINETTAAVRFNTFLPRFYSSLLSALNAERTLISFIFNPSTASSTLSTFLQSTLDALSPSFQSRLGTLADHHGPSALPELIRAYKATEELALAVQNILDAMSFNTQGGIVSGSAIASSPNGVSPLATTPDAKTPRTPHKRTMSRRFSRAPTSASDVPTTSPAEWETTLYEPFLDLQGSYASLERRYLSNLLRTDNSLSVFSLKGDASRALLDRARAAFAIAEESINRCISFTHGYGATGLIEAVGGFIEDFMDSQRDNVLDKSKSKTIGRDGGKDDLDFEGLDYSTEDWGSFQLGLHVLSACMVIGEMLGKFEGRVSAALKEIEVTSRIQPSQPSSVNLHDTTLGAIALLQQSPLNSADLHTLLSSSSTSNSTPILPAREALDGFTRNAQLFLQGIILSPLQSQLAGYPNLPIWSQPDKAPRRGELQVPTFSLSPTDTIARVSEGLLNLLRVFEVYASDNSLSYRMEFLPFIDVDLLNEASSAQGGIGPETTLSTWVSSLSLSLLSHLTKDVLSRINGLSTGGAAQLASDLGYLSNAVRALDVEWEELERWKEAVGVAGEEEWRTRFREVRESGEGEEVWRKVGALRGWQ